MKTKRCTVEPTPEPPPPDPCKIQRINQKIKAGIKICPPVPIEQPPPPPSCHALCIEKIKNIPVTVSEQPVVCKVERQMTGTARCDKIEDLTASHPDIPWPGCMPPPPLPPPPEPDLCEELEKKAKIAQCKERMASSKLDSLVEKFRTETSRQSEVDFKNTRKLTTESPYKPQDVGPSHDIDRQITDLESLIKRLQDEIIDMSTEDDKSVDEHDLREWFTKSHFNFKTDEDKFDTDKTNSHVYPVIIPNVGPNNTEQQVDIITDSFESTSELTENFSTIRRNFSLLWNDVETDILTGKVEDSKHSDTRLAFAELRAEILKKISSVDNGMPLNNSKEDLNTSR